MVSHRGNFLRPFRHDASGRARSHAGGSQYGVIVSYDLNYRESLWKAFGGKERAQEVNRKLAPYVDVMLGNEEDFSAALGYAVKGVDENFAALDAATFQKMIEAVLADFPFRVVATTLRHART